MMRINLLAEAACDETRSPIAGPAAAFQARVFALSLAAVVALLGAAWWLLGAWQTRLDARMAAEKSESNRLASIGAENKRYQSDLQDVNRRIAAVELLESNRRGPVEFLASLEEAVNRAPGLYLTSVGSKDGRLALSGEAGSVAPIADLVTALQGSGGYHDVSLREYHQDDDKDGRVRFKYSLDFTFQPPAAAVVAAPPASDAKVTGPVPAERPQASAEKRHG
jgi:Tfp pilus assembly protein PilN